MSNFIFWKWLYTKESFLSLSISFYNIYALTAFTSKKESNKRHLWTYLKGIELNNSLDEVILAITIFNFLAGKKRWIKYRNVTMTSKMFILSRTCSLSYIEKIDKLKRLSSNKQKCILRLVYYNIVHKRRISFSGQKQKLWSTQTLYTKKIFGIFLSLNIDIFYL